MAKPQKPIKGKPETPPSTLPAEFSKEELALADEMLSWPQLPKFKDTGTSKVAFTETSGEYGDKFNIIKLASAFGVKSVGGTEEIISNLANMGTTRNAEGLNRNIDILAGIAPQNTTEALLAVQMIGCHNAATEYMRRAIALESTGGIDANVNRAVKLMRTFTAQVEALQKLRGKGQQTVRVEHVNVHAGGQAIVGHVEHKAGGEGAKDEKQG